MLMSKYITPVMHVDQSGYLPSWLKIGLVATAIIAVVAITVVTFGAGSIAGTVVISGALNIAFQTATVGVAQAHYSKSEGDSKDEVRKDVVDAIADSIGVIALKNLGVKGTMAAGSVGYGAVMSNIMNIDFSTSAIKVTPKVGGLLKTPTSTTGYRISYGISTLFGVGAVASIFNEDTAYFLADYYGWSPR